MGTKLLTPNLVAVSCPLRPLVPQYQLPLVGHSVAVSYPLLRLIHELVTVDPELTRLQHPIPFSADVKEVAALGTTGVSVRKWKQLLTSAPPGEQ